MFTKRASALTSGIPELIENVLSVHGMVYVLCVPDNLPRASHSFWFAARFLNFVVR